MNEPNENADRNLALPPMTRRMQWFSLTMFFVAGIALTAFVLTNPFDLPFLPDRQQATADRSAATATTSTQLYQCPMHPQVIEEQQGDCPICLMKLTPMDQQPTGHEPATEIDPTAEREILYYYAPMDPTYMRHEPGLSPMGMQLVPKYADEVQKEGPGVLRIDPVQVQNSGVVSRPATVGVVARSARTVGILDFNADQITWINTKFSGWIEKVHVNYVGQEVRKGQPMFEIYSPELVTTQEEFLRALAYRKSLEGSTRVEARRQADNLVRSSRERLAYWDIDPQHVEALEAGGRVQRRLPVAAPADGVVTEVLDQALEGVFVRAGVNLYRMADLSSLWVHADVYESDLPWVRANQSAEVSFRHDPDIVVRGKVLFLYPEVSKETRTLKICVEIPNENGRLRAGMYADVLLEGPPVRDAVLVPNSAVLRSGERELVFVDLGEGRFEARPVEIGVRGLDDRIQIVRGIRAGESVVTQGQFMLDSESRLQEAIARFTLRGTRTSPGDDHGGPP